MKRNQWQRRLLSWFLAVAVLLGGFLCCLPMRTGAIVPLGLVQSALASYVASVGYKMFNDQGTGQEILGALGDLYDFFATSPTGTALNILSLTALADAQDIYLDLTGNMIVSKSAADMFQSFSDWLQTEYSIPDNTEEPTQVVQPQTGSTMTDDNGHLIRKYTATTYYDTNFHGYKFYFCVSPAMGSLGASTSVVFGNTASNATWYFTKYNGILYLLRPSSGGGNQRYIVCGYDTDAHSPVNPYYSSQVINTNSWANWNYSDSGLDFSDVPTSTSAPTGTHLEDYHAINAISGLALSLAQSVIDRANQLDEDESLVIGVGADAGATAADIADIVAQGVKAQTLDPSVTVVADAVIDTPVQPYPDIDGLGLPTLGAALVSRFPFCVPWDFVDTLRILNAAPIPPVFDVTLVPASVAARWGVSGNYTLHVDLTSPEYAKLFVALRWGTLVGFCLGLALLTKRLIWTA